MFSLLVDSEALAAERSDALDADRFVAVRMKVVELVWVSAREVVGERGQDWNVTLV